MLATKDELTGELAEVLVANKLLKVNFFFEWRHARKPTRVNTVGQERRVKLVHPVTMHHS